MKSLMAVGSAHDKRVRSRLAIVRVLLRRKPRLIGGVVGLAREVAMLDAVLTQLARQSCPRCGADQRILARYGVRWRVRKVDTVMPCPNCDLPARLVYRRSGLLEAGQLTGMLLLYAVFAALVAGRVIGDTAPAGPGIVVLATAALFVSLLAWVVFSFGITLRLSRTVEAV